MTPQELSRTPSGRMTAVMRAVSRPAGPVVLRVALVRGGAVIEERTLEGRAEITIGPTERSTFVVPEHHVPEPIRLFDFADGRYRLHCGPSMKGRASALEGMIELDGSGVRRVALDAGSRGRVVLGDTTVLFHVAPAPPAARRAALPRELRAGLADGIDWMTTVIAALSFVLHFGAVGSLWSDWMDPVLDDEVRTADLVESLRGLPAPPRLEVEQDTSAAKDAAPPQPQRTGGPTGGQKAPGGRGAGKPGPGGSRMSDAAASALASEMRQLELAMMTSLGGSRGAADSVLRDSEVPAQLLEEAASSAAGVGRGAVAGLRLGDSPGGVVRPGSARSGDPLGHVEQGAPASAGSAAAVKKPVGNANVSPPETSGGSVPNAGGTVAGLKGGFKACYRRGLEDEDPMMQGSVRITAKIGPNGEVLSAAPSGGGGLSAKVRACVAGRVAGARFEPPEGGFAIVVVPVTFVRQ